MMIDTDKLEQNGLDVDDKYIRTYYSGKLDDSTEIILIVATPKDSL